MAKKKVIVSDVPEEAPAVPIKEKKAADKAKEEKVVEAAFAKEEELGQDEMSQIEKDIQAMEDQEFDEEIETERKYTINLFKEGVGSKPRNRRAKKAVTVVKEFIERHMKAEGKESIYIHPDLNEKLWERGIRKPPRKIKVRTTKSKDGIVRVFLD
jgi:large subunit ribosomal protein L31e